VNRFFSQQNWHKKALQEFIAPAGLFDVGQAFV
jgi:hypothetical protein